MTQIIGELLQQPTEGEKKTLRSLNRLSNDWLVYLELPIQGDGQGLQPDFILLHPRYGLIVLEVKDWSRISSANPHNVYVRVSSNQDRKDKNPATSLATS